MQTSIFLEVLSLSSASVSSSLFTSSLCIISTLYLLPFSGIPSYHHKTSFVHLVFFVLFIFLLLCWLSVFLLRFVFPVFFFTLPFSFPFFIFCIFLVFCFVLFLFCFVLFCFVLFCFVFFLFVRGVVNIFSSLFKDKYLMYPVTVAHLDDPVTFLPVFKGCFH